MPAQLTTIRATPWAARAFARAASTAGLVGDVAGAEDAADFGCDLFAAFGVHIEQRDLDAVRGQHAGRGLAEAGGAAGDDGGEGGIELHRHGPVIVEWLAPV